MGPLARALRAGVLLTAFLMAGCGDDQQPGARTSSTRGGDASSATAAGPAEFPPAPSEWKVTFTPLDADKPPYSFRWVIAPECADWRCDLVAEDADGGGTFDLRWSAARKGWTQVVKDDGTPTRSCPASPGHAAIKRAYYERSRLRLRPWRRKGGEVVEMRGYFIESYTPTGRARARGCRGATYRDRVLLRSAR